MRGMTLENIAAAAEGRLVIPPGCEAELSREAVSVVYDSRKAEEGGIFVAARGEHSDGHDYIDQVFEKGVLGVICERIPEGTKGPCIVVEESFAAMRKLAAYYRTVMSGVKIVGIVGSVGKTSTKELVASVLGQQFVTLKTEGNLNNEIGVPVTILRLRDCHEAAVVEMGINHFGEMDRLGAIVKPDAVVFTNVGPCHLEYLHDLDGVLRAKSEVFGHIRPGGVLILNGEDETLKKVGSEAGVRIVRYGEGGSVYARGAVDMGLKGSTADVHIADGGGNETVFSVTIPLPGAHMVANSLAAAAVGHEFGMTPEKIAAGIAAAQPVSGRSNLIDTGSILIVDDCYNANPKSDMAAIDMMGSASGRKVAILGDMFELGENGRELHAEVGRYAAEHGIDLLVCVGELSEAMYEAARAQGADARYFSGLEAFEEGFDGLGIRKGDTVLVKASHGMKFEGIVKGLTDGTLKV